MNDSNNIERTRDNGTEIFVVGLNARNNDYSHNGYDILG
jgi:hypothetical protein